MSRRYHHGHWRDEQYRKDEQSSDPKAAQAMEQRTGMLFCPQCHLPGELSPGDMCPYCGYFVRCIGCGD